MSSSGFDTGAGTYDKLASAKGGEGLDIDAHTAGRDNPPGEGVDAGAGAKDNIPGQGLSGGAGSEDASAAAKGTGEGLSAGEKGSNRTGGGVTLNAGREEEFNGPNSKNFVDVESKVQNFADKIRDKVSS
ncbi:hypothetical protein PSEUBRA_006208 [Kalmanozyma brasiliensis GHG001]|uniref:uncharacterized protein n=1 Tax=Kalmanozyma brasiliensis (strain GHG001) TaxID=1365824 RepID=UPI002867F399|nr:uncharacterized protein PSEUBRA_006208 [Kalmanozyma brasiliensis GHG001]KAF6767643.1 hypothetical protein PSEUBRA_006208 [Kalmanozyma brasiliensis GHG001]